LDGSENKEHDTYSIANRISSLVNSTLGKNATAIDAMTSKKIDDIKQVYDSDKKKHEEELRLLKKDNQTIIDQYKKLQLIVCELTTKDSKTENPSPPPINPTNYQMVVVDNIKSEEPKEKEKTTTVEKKNEVKKEEVSKHQITKEEVKEFKEMQKIEDDEIKKHQEISVYFSKIQNYILKDKKNDEQFRIFIRGELKEIIILLKHANSDQSSSLFKYEPVYQPVYQYFIELINRITDEYIKSNFKEINFILDPTSVGKISLNMSELFASAVDTFCYPLIEEFLKDGKIQIDS
jgi:hypothetical protein